MQVDQISWSKIIVFFITSVVHFALAAKRNPDKQNRADCFILTVKYPILKSYAA